jgi:hypothetical protein
LEVLEEAGFDGGGDVGVGFADFVFEDVAEAEPLGDFGDAVVDHPGFVAVAESVEGEPGFDGFESHAGLGDVEVAVGAGAHGAAGEVAAPVQLEFGGSEQVRVLVGWKVGSE